MSKETLREYHEKSSVVRRMLGKPIEVLVGLFRRKPPFESPSSQWPKEPPEPPPDTVGVREPRIPPRGGLEAKETAVPRRE